jgi:hypothetical protein
VVQTSSRSAAVNVRVLGAIKAEDLYDDSKRKVLLSKSRGPNRQEPIPQAARHRALALQVRLVTPTGTFAVEEMAADVAACRMRTNRG